MQESPDLVRIRVVDDHPDVFQAARLLRSIRSIRYSDFSQTFSATKTDGSGIGLSLSRQFMRAHGGTMGIKSNPGEKTTVTLRF